MNIYISGINSISAIEKFSMDMAVPEKQDLQDMYAYIASKEPVYKEIINPMLLRRMSRVMKMGLASALLCLKDAGKDMPEAIITSTGLGCVEDSDKFLTSLIENNETMLNPTPFIQSTHNTIGAQIALQLKCYGYNSTYAGRGACFEMALLDSLMLLEEKEVNNVLVGGYDELTPNMITILYRLGMFRSKARNDGIIPGEGASFALLSNEKGKNDYACIKGVSLLNEKISMAKQIESFLSEHELSIGKIDSFMLGTNEKDSQNENYKELINNFDKSSNIVWFKHLNGEYPTSSSFALWLAVSCIKNQCIPDVAILRKGHTKAPDNMLVINHTMGNQYSVILLSKC
jgi:3-oxoacyl-[acyl-carrier-protein] synthase II